MYQVGIYCRLSVEDQHKIKSDDSQSIQNQKAMLLHYCQEHDWKVCQIYCDDGYSGTDPERPAFRQLIADCQAGKINLVLCKDQSRFSRDIIVIETYLNDKFLEWGVRFVGISDNADSDNENYGAVRLLSSAYNELYVRDISNKIRKTLAFKRQQGQFVGSFAPYGYQTDPKDKHHLIPDPETAPVVRQIFHYYLQGDSYRKIIQKLNQKNILSPFAYKQKTGSLYQNYHARQSNSKGLWTQSTVAGILRNEVYTGTLVQGKTHHISYKNKKRKKVSPEKWVRIPGTHERIIDAVTWEQVQERLNSHIRASRNTQTVSPLSGKVRCAVCGRPMKRNVYYNKSRTISYYNLQCASYKTGAMNCPNTRTISGKILEEKILEELNQLIRQYVQPEQLILPDSGIQKQLAEFQKQETALKQQLLQSYQDKCCHVISEQEYQFFQDSFRKELKNLSEKIRQISAQPPEQYFPFIKLSRELVENWIDYLEIGQVQPDGTREISIHWKI